MFCMTKQWAWAWSTNDLIRKNQPDSFFFKKRKEKKRKHLPCQKNRIFNSPRQLVLTYRYRSELAEFPYVVAYSLQWFKRRKNFFCCWIIIFPFQVILVIWNLHRLIGTNMALNKKIARWQMCGLWRLPTQIPPPQPREPFNIGMVASRNPHRLILTSARREAAAEDCTYFNFFAQHGRNIGSTCRRKDRSHT